MRPSPTRLAIVLSGGGARAAYQAGVLRFLATRFPEFSPDVLTGVSAGAVNAAYLASRTGTFRQKADDLADLWTDLRIDQVFRVDVPCLALNVARWGLRLLSGGSRSAPPARSLVDTQPLRRLLNSVLGAENGTLSGIGRNRRSPQSGRAYSLQLLDRPVAHLGAGLQWERAHRRSVNTRLTVEHVMASSALPLFFPAVQVDGLWCGDGGIRLTAPLSPAVHLGAERILAISSHYARSREEANRPAIDGYPPAAQVAGVLLDAIFLDLLDADALRLERINQLVDVLPDGKRGSMRHDDLLVLQPSRDLGRLVNEYETELPRAFRFLMRGLGTRETRSNGLLSLVMFQSDYLRRLIELGEADAWARADEIGRFLQPETLMPSRLEVALDRS